MLRENTRLVRRMMQIRNSPGQLNPRLLGLRSPRASLSLNFPRRMREYSSLLAGNKVRQRGREGGTGGSGTDSLTHSNSSWRR